MTMLPSPKPSDRQVNCGRRGSKREFHPKVAQKSLSVIAETTESSEGQDVSCVFWNKMSSELLWHIYDSA